MYFSLVPNIEYDEKPISYPFSTSDFVTAKNFFRRYKVNDDVFSYAVLFNKYTIKDGDTPDTLANAIYGSPFYDWVLLLTNNMINVQYDWPLSNSVLSDVMENEYNDPYGTIHHYETFEIANSAGQIVLEAGKTVDEEFYNAPSFTFSNNPPAELPIPTSTKQASAQVLYNNFVSSIQMTQFGIGYESIPSVSLVPSNGASATPNMSPTAPIKRINVVSGGLGYEYPPTVTFTGSLSSLSATAQLGANGTIESINLDGIKFDTTNSNQIYEFGNGTTIAPNGSGSGSTGGFNIGSTHLRFGDASGVRYAVLQPVDTRQINTVRVYAIRGNGSNGGETPDVNGTEDLYLQYQITDTGAVPSTEWVDLGIVIDAVPNGSGSGVLDNYDFILPAELKNENVYFRLYQPGNSGANFDHYGILSVNFLNLQTEYDVNGGIEIAPNPLDSNPENITAASAQIIFGRRLESITVLTSGSGFGGNVAPTVNITGGSPSTPGQATAYIGYNLTTSILDAGLGYDSATATITGGGGTDATALVNISSGSVSSIQITNQGTGYTSEPSILITPPTIEDISVNDGDVKTIDGQAWKYSNGQWLRQATYSFKYYNNGTYTLKNGNEICRPVTIAEWFTTENEKKREIFILKRSYFRDFVDDFRKKNLYQKSDGYITQRLKKTT
jgi:hypothetical protein